VRGENGHYYLGGNKPLALQGSHGILGIISYKGVSYGFSGTPTGGPRILLIGLESRDKKSYQFWERTSRKIEK
jgi:hypothetical protein